MATESMIDHAGEAAGAASHAADAAHGGGVHVELAAERIGELWGIPITNTLLMSWIVVALLLTIGFLIGRKLRMQPGKLQTSVELLFSYIRDFIESTLENPTWARRLFPLLLTIFLFIATANALEFTPGIGSIKVDTVHGAVPLLRSMNTDLNMTLALTVIVVLAIEIAGIVALGFWKYAGKFINFSGHSISERLINFSVGVIELVSELSRFVSFSFRLFGNIFAGEVLIGVVAFFVPYFLPVPLMAFEMFVGIVQGAVFALLTLFFVKMAIMEPHGSH